MAHRMVVRRPAAIVFAIELLIAAAALAESSSSGAMASARPVRSDGVQAVETQLMPLAPPDIFGPGKVLDVGRVHMKVTNYGVIGNPFTNISSDPSGQWPEASGVEYLNAIVLAVGAVDPTAPDSTRHRVSYFSEWRPPTLEVEDRIYSAYEGIINGDRFFNDDADVTYVNGEPRARIDEDPLDGRDNDGDARIDEDYDARGWQEYSCVIRDDTQEAMQDHPEHVPLGIECRQLAWTYGAAGFNDFNVVEYTFINRSGHPLDSLYIGWRVDMDAGPVSTAQYFLDDLDLPGFPSGEFTMRVGFDAGDLPDPLRRQFPHSPALNATVPAESALCPRVAIRLNGFALSDDDGDGGATPGTGAFLLVHHTIDPLGQSAPQRVGFRAFRSFTGGTPFAMGGNPATDPERYAFMSSTENIDPSSGFISAAPGASHGDYLEWCSIGPFRNVPDGGSIEATIAFAVQNGSHATGLEYPADYDSYRAGSLSAAALLAKYPVLSVARDIQVAYEGLNELRESYQETQDPSNGGRDFHGRETLVQLPLGSPPVLIFDCRSLDPRLVTDQMPAWFDFDCDYCTGVWDYGLQRGLFHHTWKGPQPPVSVENVGPESVQLIPAPNPAIESCSLRFTLAAGTDVRAEIFDVTGRRVRQVASKRLERGPHLLQWNLRDQAGDRVPPGLYFWRVRWGNEEQQSRPIVVTN